MSEITVDTFWDPENKGTTTQWISTTLFLLIEADLKHYPPPTTIDVMLNLGISDEILARYILTWTQGFFFKLRRMTGSTKGVLKKLAQEGWN